MSTTPSNPVIKFPHAGNQTMPLVEFVSAWKEFVALHYQNSDKKWETICIPRMNAMEVAASAENRDPKSFDMLCRHLPKGFADTMHATGPFMDANRAYLEECKTKSNRSDQMVQGCRLTQASIDAGK